MLVPSQRKFSPAVKLNTEILKAENLSAHGSPCCSAHIHFKNGHQHSWILLMISIRQKRVILIACK